MSATTELALLRLEALGAITVDPSAGDPRYARAAMLVDMAAEQVLDYINLDDAGIAVLDESLRGIVATAVAETASSRLQYPASPSSDAFGAPDGMFSIVLPRRVLNMLDRAFPGGSGVSLTVTRDESSSYFAPYTGEPGDPFYVNPLLMP